MSKKEKQMLRPLNRWIYFTENLYRDPSDLSEFEYDHVIYYKSEELMEIEAGNKKINWVLLLILFVMFAVSIQFQNIWFVAGYLVVVILGQVWRWQRLPKDIMAHLTDSGRRKK